MMRQLIEADMPGVLKMSEAFWAETGFEEPFEATATKRIVHLAMSHNLAAVVEQDGKLVGFMLAVQSPLLCSDSSKLATELAFWIEPPYRGGGTGLALMKYMEGQAKQEGVKYFNMACLEASMPSIANMYVKQGYNKAETTFTRVL